MIRKLVLIGVLMPMMALAATWYVNGSTGTDSNSGRSESSAKATIQAAIDASAEGDTILVAPGTYAPIATDNKTITIKSVAGTTSTIIDGGNSQPCAILGNAAGDRATVLDGFTICKGYTSNRHGAGVYRGTIKNCYVHSCTNTFRIFDSEGGGAYGTLVEDCVFENNCATHGAGLFEGVACRSVFRNNYAYDDGGAMDHSSAYDCLIVDNYANNWGGSGAGAAGCFTTNYNCTVVNNHADSGGIFSGQSVLVNCIVADNDGTLAYEDSEQHTSMINCYVDTPGFVDADNGDYRLAAGSLCIDAGDNSYVTTTTDLAGTPRIVNGKVDIGCYEYGAAPTANGLYMVIDLSGGPSAASYPVSYLNAIPDGGWTDEYKTAKLVLRRIEPGTFTMGSPVEEVGRYNAREPQRQITLTKAYYIGVFEITQRQWELVMGSTPSQYAGIMRPVESVSYDMIRGAGAGAGWPSDSLVDSDSFMGVLRAKTGQTGLDLPTSAQWEYACRAGTSTAFNNGTDADSEVEDAKLSQLGRYKHNQDDGKGGYTTRHTTVGSYMPNAWGIYDMLGNVLEWCLDYYEETVGETTDVSDPVGPRYGSKRVQRGGSAWSDVCDCRSAFVMDQYSWHGPGSYGDFGFRIAMTSNGIEVTPVLHTVTFDINGAGGAAPAGRSVAHGAAVGELPDVTRADYSFDGWYTTASGGTKIDAATTVTADVTYYAHWTASASIPDVTTWKFYEEADDEEGLNLAAWEDWGETDVAFWIGEGINMAIPVDGNLSASDVVLIAGTYSGYRSVQVVSDEWMFAKHYMALKNAIGREPYGNEYGAYGSVFEDDVGERNYSLSLDIWPEKKVVSGRQWILLEIGGNPTKGCKTFYLGLKGRDEAGYSRFRIYATPDQGVPQTPSSWSSQRELAVLPTPIGGGTTSGSGMYANGTQVTLSATAAKGYTFDKWSDGDTNPSRTVVVDANRVIYACFKEAEGGVKAFGPFVAGGKVDVDVGLVGYTAKGLPSGLKYDAKKGIVSGTVKTVGEYEVTFMKKGENAETVFFTVRAEEVSVGCEGLSGSTFTAGVAGSADGIPLEIESETGVKSVSVTKLPSGMKYDSKSGRIIGAPTKAGDYNVVVTVTTESGAKRTESIKISVAALSDNAVGTFNGFVKADDGEENVGTFQLAATDAGKLTAKVITAAGTYSFGGTCWDKVEDGIYSATLKTKKGETLSLELDSAAGWNEDQLTGTFAAANGAVRRVVARRNAFGKTWYFAADGDTSKGWILSYVSDAKTAALTVTLNADGSTKIAGKLGTISVNASGYSDVTGLANGVIYADFAPVVSIRENRPTAKRVLSIRTNLWFDRSNEHGEGVGSAVMPAQ